MDGGERGIKARDEDAVDKLRVLAKSDFMHDFGEGVDSRDKFVEADRVRFLEIAQRLAVDLVVVGPEVPLVNGVADVLREAGFAVFGPSKAAAQLEGSKDFAKGVMRDAGVPTAHSFTCTTQEEIEICKVNNWSPARYAAAKETDLKQGVSA